MSDWKGVTLSEIATIQTGPFGSQLHASDYVVDGVPSIMPKNIGDRLDININDIARVRESDAVRLAKYRVTSGDIVYSRRGDVEKCAFITKQLDGWLCGTGCIRVRFTSSQVDPMFIALHLSTDETRGWISGNAVGTIMPNLNTEILQRVPLNLPSLREQRAIAGVLSSLDDKIDLLHRQNKTVESLAETLFRQSLDVFPTKVKPLGTLIKETVGGDWGKETPEEDFNTAVNCLRGTDLANLKDSLPSKTPVRFIKEEKLEKIRLLPGDIVFEISGGTENQSTGRAAIATEKMLQLFDNPAVFSNFCRLFRPHQKELGTFLYFYLTMLYSQDEFFALENGSSGIKNLAYKTLLEDFHYPIPSHKDCVKIGEELYPFLEKFFENKLQIRLVEKLRDTLLPKLMSGEVRVEY